MKHTKKQFKPADFKLNPADVHEQLKRLRYAAHVIELAMGVALRETSFLRNSTSHRRGVALDVAPFKSEELMKVDYAMRLKRDPLLVNRPELISRMFQSLKRIPLGYLIAVENDHLHLQLLSNTAHPSLVMRFPTNRDHLYENEQIDIRNGRQYLFGSNPNGPQPQLEVDRIYPPLVGIMSSGVTIPYQQVIALLH
jgi:hypothetical protein